MELSTLRFIVETKDLEEAAKKIDALGVSVSKLNKPMQAMSTESAKANKELSKAEEAAAKAALAQLKLEQAQNKSTQATRKSISVSERQTLILKYQAEGNSKGQASILATAKAAGALDDEMLKLTRTLNLQRTLMGTEPFDNSIGLHQKLQNQTKITDEVTNLFNRSLGLTEKQMVDLAREKQRLIALYGIEGKSLAGLDAEYEQIVQMSRQITQSNDARTKSMKDQIKAQNDATKATEYLANETERVNRLTAAGTDITSATNNKLIKFEQALKLSGKTAAEQTVALEKYKASLLSIQKASGNRQVDYLSRALGPQITDIFVGLATGQSPMMVLLQQGGQLRDQFALAGVAAKDMGSMLTKATVGMASSVKDVAVAVGSALGGAFIASGKAANKFIGNITGISPYLENLRYQIALMQGSDGDLMKLFKGSAVAIQILTGVIFAGAIAALVAFGIALKQVIAEESALSKSLALTGASLGLTRDSALGLAKELAGTKGNISSYVTTLTEMAKAGGISSENLKTIASTIVGVSKILGVSSEDLAKNFSKISEKPLEGLIPFAKELGTIDVALLKQIQKLEISGKHTEAATLAVEAYAKALKGAADTVKEEMGGFETIFFEIGAAAKSMWNSILNVGRKGDLQSQMADAVASLIEARGGKSWYARFGRTNEEEVAYYEAIVQSIGLQINAQKKLGDTKAENVKKVSKFEKDLKEQGAAEFKVPEDLYLKRLKQEYADTTKTIDSEFKRLLTENKTNYELGLIDLGEYLGRESSLIIDQNNQKIKTNNDYRTSLVAARDIQLKAIGDMVAKESVKNKTTADAKKLQEQYKESLTSTKEAYNGLTDAAITNNEVLSDKSIEEQLKSLAKFGELTKKVIEDSKNFTKSLEDTAAKRKLQMDLDEKLIGMSGKEAEILKATVAAEQDRIAALSALTLVAKEASIALDELSLKGFAKDPDEYKKAVQALQIANKKLDEARVASRLAVEQTGVDAGIAYERKERDRLNSEITDGLVTALIEGGESGGKKLRSIIEAELKRPITVFVRAVVDILGSGINSAIGGKAGSTLGSTLGGAVGNLFSGSALGATLFGNSAAYGAAIGTTSVGAGSQAAMLAAQTGEFGAAGLSATAGSAGFGASMAAAGPYVLAALAVANALGLFRSTKQVGGGISGTLGGTGSVDQYGLMRKSGTLFNGPSYFRQNQGTFAGNEALQQTFDQLKTSTKMMADTLKLSSAGIEDFTKVIDISFDGLTDAQRQEKLTSTFKDINDELAALVLGAGATAEQLSTLYNNVMQQRYDLETQLLELQGKTLELRERERAKIFDVNKEMFDQIKALEDQKAANEAAAVAMEKLTSVTTTIVDEINRLRGVSQTSSGLESQFAILTAQARSGNLTALAQLPEVTKGLEQIAASSAVNATDIIFARARLAQSLQDTLGYFPAGTLSTATTSVATLPSVATASAGASVSAASSNQELLAALVVEVQGLRAEVRADVSHNAKTAKILERVNQDGESLTITALV